MTVIDFVGIGNINQAAAVDIDVENIVFIPVVFGNKGDLAAIRTENRLLGVNNGSISWHQADSAIVHVPDIEFTIDKTAWIRTEDDLATIRAEDWIQVVCGIVGEVHLAAAVGVHNVNLIIVVAI